MVPPTMRSLIRRLAAAFVVMAMLAGPLAASAAPARAPSPISDTSDRPAETRQDIAAAQEGAALGTPEAASDPSIADRAEEPAAADEPPPPAEEAPPAADGAVAVETPPAPAEAPSDPAGEAPPAEPVTEPVPAPATEPAPAPPEQPPVDAPAGDPTAEPEDPTGGPSTEPDALAPDDDAAAEPTEAGTAEPKADQADQAEETPTLALAANQPPVAVADAYAVKQGGTLTVDAASGLLANDADADLDPISALVSSDPLPNGTLAANGDGSFIYTPNDGFTGTETFTYIVSDGTFDFSEPATVTITVAGNGPPIAVNDGYTVGQDETLSVDAASGVLANDADPDGDPIAITVLQISATLGTVSALSPDGAFTYDPPAGFVGTDSFGYIISDGFAQSGSATVTITVVPAGNGPPVAGDDGYTVGQDETLSVDAASGVLANDADPDGDPIAITVLQISATLGTVSALSPDGAFTYDPPAGFVGTDSFGYIISDGFAQSGSATVTITVEANGAPVATDDAYSVKQDATLAVDAAAGLLTNDTDPEGDQLTVEDAINPAHGTLTFDADGSFVYTPDAGFTGTDGFQYTLFDQTDSATANVTIEVVSNTGPVATDDAYTAHQDTPLTVAAGAGVLANDTDPDGDALTIDGFGGTAHGTISMGSGGSFVYTPAAGFVGTDGFGYTVTDGGATDDAVVTVTVHGGNRPPVGQGDSYETVQSQVLTVDAPGVLANDTDLDGDLLQVERSSDPSQGKVRVSRNGSFVYTPDPQFVGTDSFTYRVTDGVATSGDITARIVVAAPVNTAPVAVDDAYTVTQGAILDVDAPGPFANDTDAEGDPFVLDFVGTVAHGTLFGLDPDGAFTYTPDAGFVGTDSFVYRIKDISEGLISTSGTVTITVAAAEPNTAPVAVDDAFTVGQGATLTVAVPGVFANDADAEGDPFVLDFSGIPTNGTLLGLELDGSFTYTPDAGFVGTDSFTYAIKDIAEDLISPRATVTITVTATGTNTPPVAVDDSVTTPKMRRWSSTPSPTTPTPTAMPSPSRASSPVTTASPSSSATAPSATRRTPASPAPTRSSTTSPTAPTSATPPPSP